jgi:hypothetical protein
VKNFLKIDCLSLLCATAGLLTLLVATTASTPALAQAADAADRCTPDVMRLCSEYIPDADRIVVCLKAKRRQLSHSCSTALTPAKSTPVKSKKRHRVRHRES